MSGTMVPVVWLSLNPDTPARGYWDHAMVEDLLLGRMWKPAEGYVFAHSNDESGRSLRVHDGAVVVFPARAQVDRVDELNRLLAHLRWVVLILTGDEEAVFPVERLTHPNMRVWVMSPRPGRHDGYRRHGTGYTPHVASTLPTEVPAKDVDWFFAGQVTHVRREECAAQLRDLGGGRLIESPGFTQGLGPDQYVEALATAKVVPSPSGPVTPDSFRLFEALEAGCVPVADPRTPGGSFPDDYWTWFFGGEPPFPVVTEYAHLPAIIADVVADYPVTNNRVFAWWQAEKRRMAQRLRNDIHAVSNISGDRSSLRDLVTVLVPTSVAPLHPSTSHIEETIASIRSHLPDCEIIVTVDGLRPEQADRAVDYSEYVRRLLWLCNRTWTNVLPVVFESHHHQAAMTRSALELVETSTVLFVEHDTPLVVDCPIDFEGIVQTIVREEAHLVRLHHEAAIHPEHESLMIGGVEDLGVPMRRTFQWSQRPHVAAASFYRRILNEHFSSDARCFIEDKMHSVCQVAVDVDGVDGWERYRLWTYHPDGNIKRSYHLDSRAGAAKFDDRQVW